MIARRPFSRVDRLWKVACIANSLSSPQFHSQGCFGGRAFCILKMGGSKDGLDSIYRYNKRKSVMPVWRPVSTQSGSILKDAKASPKYPCEAVNCTEKSDVGYQFHEVDHSASSCVPDIQNEAISGTTVSLTSTSNAMEYNNESEAVKETQSVVSSCEKENLSERRYCTAISESDRVHHQEEVIEKTVHDLVANMDAELASEVVKHSVSVEVDASLIRFIKGKGGSTQKQIEGETGVKITFPSFKKEGYIVVEGTSVKSLSKASEKIASVLEEAVRSPSLDYSHFISLPLAIHPELVEKLQNFQSSILGCVTSGQDGDPDSDSNEDASDDNDKERKKSESRIIAVKLEVQNEKEHVSVKLDTTDANSNASKIPSSSILSGLGIDRSIFIKPKTFHLTVLMLKLWNKDRVAAATEVLQKISTQVNDALENRPVSIRLKGLECMRGSAAKARVLYAPVEEIGGEGRLFRACQVIIKAYVEAGLVLDKDARQTLKLHATLMNARHGKRKKTTRRHDSFDARGIFLRYGSADWGDYLIREAHLSQRFVFDESGYYHCCTSIPFPESK